MFACISIHTRYHVQISKNANQTNQPIRTSCYFSSLWDLQRVDTFGQIGEWKIMTFFFAHHIHEEKRREKAILSVDFNVHTITSHCDFAKNNIGLPNESTIFQEVFA